MSDCIVSSPQVVDVVTEPIEVDVTLAPTTVEVLHDANIIIRETVDFANLPVFTNNQAAINGGLSFGDIYKTPDGFVRVVINYVGFSNLSLNLSTGFSYLVRAF